MKYVFLALVLLGIFWWLAPKFIGGLNWLLSKPCVVVDFSDGIRGKIVRHSVNRRKYTYTIAERKEDFDFDRFANEAIWQNNRLGTYIEDGDFIEKAPNSGVLTLDRNGQTSKWTLVGEKL